VQVFFIFSPWGSLKVAGPLACKFGAFCILMAIARIKTYKGFGPLCKQHARALQALELQAFDFHIQKEQKFSQKKKKI
jgi:hypothetical protein